MEPVHAVVLAAGKGKRMHSGLPKVLHLLCGQPLILYVLDALHHAGIPSSIVVVGQGDDHVREVVGPQAQYVEQPEPRGTGHAVMTALPLLPQDSHPVLGLYGDTPLLTADTIGWLLARGRRVSALVARAEESVGVNSRLELAAAEAFMRRRLLDRLMEGGVTIVDPATTYVHAGVQVGPDTVIHPQSYLEGATAVGARCTIGPQARLVGASVGDDVTVVASSVEHGVIGDGSTVGPYSRLRPGTRVGRFVEIGNFAELKNAVVGDHTKVHHMSYLGDVTIGVRVNIGAGTVTCNYDGKRKHNTIIDDEAFIGSDTMLIAPIRIGKGAMTGAGSVVNKDVPPGGVAVGVPARVIRYVPSER